MFIARKLGFGWGRIRNRIAGRSITTSPPPIPIDCESNKGKHVYICFSEMFSNGCCKEMKVVRSFPSYSQEEKGPVELGFIAATQTKDIEKIMPFHPWTRFGHNILHYAGGQRISWIDTSQRRIRFEYSSRTKTKLKSFKTAKDYIMWGEIDGKLYCINSDIEYRDFVMHQPVLKSERENLFEVLDPAEKTKNPDWQPLARPPHILLHSNGLVHRHRALFLDGSKKIIAWDCNVLITCCYDVFHPEDGWKELPYDIRPHGARPFVIHHPNHPVLGDFNLLFSYQPLEGLIYPFYMSNDCHSFKPINNAPIQLPEFCSYYISRESKERARYKPSLMYEMLSCGVFEFVNMGDQMFGFMLNINGIYDSVYWPNTEEYKGKPAGLLFLMYKYNVVVVNNDLEIRTSLVGTRHFRYRSKADHHCSNYITGAFHM